MSDTNSTDNIHATDEPTATTDNIHATSEPLVGKSITVEDETAEATTDNIHATDEKA
ncbi:hypothetical protein [Streptomyces sp. NPDC005538]|uniref:hypothetical protein n=1 Tax=unclassified Streptomyces TaxID=2593676 RepID=UPI0033BF993E